MIVDHLHEMSILIADHSNEMASLIFSENSFRKIKMSSATILLGALRLNAVAML